VVDAGVGEDGLDDGGGGVGDGQDDGGLPGVLPVDGLQVEGGGEAFAAPRLNRHFRNKVAWMISQCSTQRKDGE
jgi:hypothetical protein